MWMKSQLRPAPAFAKRALAIASTPLAAEHGRFLPDAGGTTIIDTWGNANPTAFNQTVQDTVKDLNVGQIRFDYDTYERTPGNAAGGAALSGGFFMDPAFQLKPGFTLAWVQTVTATYTGANEWNLPNTGAGEFPDADPMDRAPGTFGPDDTLLAPTYVFNTPAANNTGMAPTIGYQDFPGRSFADGNQSWLAELALTCISTTATIEDGGQMFRDVRVIDSFLWGFNFNNLPVAPPGMPDIGNVGSDAPAFWSDPTASFLNTLNNYYDGMGGGGAPDGMGGQLPALATDLYKFSNNSNCFQAVVPEPGTLLLLMPGFAILLRRKR